MSGCTVICEPGCETVPEAEDSKRALFGQSLRQNYELEEAEYFHVGIWAMCLGEAKTKEISSYVSLI